jgi:virginiamycin B lyase
MQCKHALDIAWKHHLSQRDVRVLDPIDDPDVALVVGASRVPGAEPTSPIAYRTTGAVSSSKCLVMTRAASAVVTALVLVSIVAEAAGGSFQNDRSARSADEIPLLPVPQGITDACRYSAAQDDWRALCPAVLPRPFVGRPPYPSAGVMVFADPPRIDIGYGAPTEGGGRVTRSNRWRNHPCCFLHFDIQRESVYGPPRWHPKRGHAATVGGRRGWLRRAESHSYALSAYFSNHLRFFFSEAREHYVVTLHDFGAGTKALLDALVSRLEPVEPLRKPLPESPPTPCKQYRYTNICRRGPITDVAVAGSSIWITKPERDRVVRIDPATGRAAQRIHAPYPTRIVAQGESLWVVGWKRKDMPLMEIDASTGEVTRTIGLGRISPTGLAADESALWVTDSWRARVTRVDATTGIRSRIEVGRGASGVTTGFGSAWVANTADATVSRIDAATAQPVATIAVGRYPQEVIAADGSIWAANTGEGTISRIDPTTNRVVAVIDVGLWPIGLAHDGSCLWIADLGQDVVRCLDPATDMMTERQHQAGPGPFAVTAGFDSLWIVTQHALVSTSN